jgi:hypothetical protein
MIGPLALDGSKRSRNQESVFAGPKLNGDACKGCSPRRPLAQEYEMLDIAGHLLSERCAAR